jgi:aspartate/methionine/tyrosine aminotransferase
MPLNPQAVDLNETIRAVNPHVLDMLSPRGKAIYFPKRGILSQSAEAVGKEINATIGTALEDDGSPMCLDALFKQVNLKGKQAFGYAPSPGKPDIRAKWKEMLAKKNPSLAGAEISLPVVTSALTHGLSMAAYLFAGENDSIILPDLYWENYELVFTLAYGAKLATYPMFNKKSFNVEGLEKALGNGPIGKKVVLLNFPNNPTGYTATEAEAKQICDVLVKAADNGNDIVVMLDDAYFGLVFEEGIIKESLFVTLARAHERILAVKFDGPTKEDYVWGFRIGFVTFGCKKADAKLYGALEAKLAGAIRGNISNASNLGQTMLTNAYADPGYFNEAKVKNDLLRRRYQKVRDVLKSHPEYEQAFKAVPFNSGYFMCVRILKGDAEKVRQTLLAKYNTGLIAQGELLRIAFSSTPIDKVEKLFDNIYKACWENVG